MVPLKIIDPPQPLKDQWDEMLRECSHKLLRILIDHQRSQISSYKEIAHDKINQVNHIIIPEFVTNIPKIGENLEEAIENLIAEIKRTTKKLKPIKRPNENPPTIPKKKKKPSEQQKMSTEEGTGLPRNQKGNH